MISSDRLDLKKTVDATLIRAKGWWMASYPSSEKPNSKIKITITYPKDNFKKDNFKKTPKCVLISRGNTEIGFGKYTTMDTKEASYVFYFHSPAGNFTIQQTPDWGRTETGNPALFNDIQADPELSQYVSFIEMGSKRIKKSQKKPWQLTQIMQNSRA